MVLTGNMIIFVGGPAGCGKSTVASLLAEKIGCTFLEGDSLHPKENIEKMSHGIPLTDEDRWGWLASVAHESAAEAEKSNVHKSVAACSSLKKVYRDYLRKQAPNQRIVFVFINVDGDELLRRITKRKGHYMKADMLKSQLAITEVPKSDEPNCIVYHNNADIDDCMQKIDALDK